jgi:tRNA-uridine 2-sulfurtransferase
MSKTVYVGMSGGVDSSLSAALLQEQGYQVVGVYMKNWSRDLPGMDCPWRDDYRDAMRVAVHLGIDFKLYDFETQYHAQVVDYMVNEYRAGRTPNPDIMCNQEIKFKLFLRTALQDGADMIATGHYARIETSNQQSGNSSKEKEAKKLVASASLQAARLFCAKDTNKDQSYFLYRVTEKALSKTLFPISEYTKPQVRELAKKRGLATAGKKDSQGICFVGKVGIKEFLSQYVAAEPGAIIDQDDNEIGQHDGAIFYTIGQRHGLHVGGGLPYYVVGKDMTKNVVYVSTDLDDKRLWRTTLKLTDLHWINEVPPGQNLRVRTRYRAPLAECSLDHSAKGGLNIRLKDGVRAVTPGQSAVLYDGNRVAGGGIII